MIWQHCLKSYLGISCSARGLAISSIMSYDRSLRQFISYVEVKLGNKAPGAIHPREVLEYVQYLRTERKNGDSAVNRHLTILRCFYDGLQALQFIRPVENPMEGFPKVKAAPRSCRSFSRRTRWHGSSMLRRATVC